MYQGLYIGNRRRARPQHRDGAYFHTLFVNCGLHGISEQGVMYIDMSIMHTLGTLYISLGDKLQKQLSASRPRRIPDWCTLLAYLTYLKLPGHLRSNITNEARLHRFCATFYQGVIIKQKLSPILMLRYRFLFHSQTVTMPWLIYQRRSVQRGFRPTSADLRNGVHRTNFVYDGRTSPHSNLTGIFVRILQAMSF